MQDAHSRQIGGTHYLKLGMQPFQFTLPNGWDGATHTILKYVSRHHNVDTAEAIESLRKALHLIDIRNQAIETNNYANTVLGVSPKITMAEYLRANQLGDLEAVACNYLSAWVYSTEIEGHRVSGAMVWNAIEDILINRYGVGA